MPGDRTVARPGVLDGPGEYLLVTALALLAAVMTGTWMTGQAAGLLFRQAWPPVSITQSLSIATRLPAHLGDPRMAWPAHAQATLPGPAGFAAAAVLTAAVMTAAAIITARRVLGGRSRRGYASPQQIRARLSEKAVLARADVIRPSLAGAAPHGDRRRSAGRALPASRHPARDQRRILCPAVRRAPDRQDQPGRHPLADVTGPAPRW